MRPNGTKTMWELEAMLVCLMVGMSGADSGWSHSKKQVRGNLISALDSGGHAP